MSNLMSNVYIAILTPTRRDVNTLSPKRLLLNIVNAVTGEVFRDHQWVPDNDKINRILNYKSTKKKVVFFNAKETTYLSSKGTKKKLHKIKNMQEIHLEELPNDLRSKFNKRLKKRVCKRVSKRKS